LLTVLVLPHDAHDESVSLPQKNARHEEGAEAALNDDA
jgi:hypothetical protein